MCRWLIPIALATALAATGQRPAHAASPFAPGGPLAPWSGPLPTRRLNQPAPPVPTQYASGWQPPSATPLPPAPAAPAAASSGSSAGWAPVSSPVAAWIAPGAQPLGGLQSSSRWRPLTVQQPASLDSPPEQKAPRAARSDESRTWVSALFNPAMAPWGRMAGRLEFAPLSAHAIYLEFSKINFFVKNIEREVPVYEYDLGYHLYPQGRGVSGFYLGPRVILARGETDEAVGKATGIGGDIGYQFVIASHFVINAGIGAAHFTASAEARPGWENKLPDGVTPEQASAFGANLSFGEQVEIWLPLATLGLGLAF